MTPTLSNYDRVVINSSAGKDSQTMLRRVVQAAGEQGVHRSHLVVVHCDLGRVEWQGVPELARVQAEHYGLEFVTVSRPQGDLLEHVRQRGMWPSPANRYCTSDHKRGQVHKLFTAIVAKLPKLGRPARILNCLGMRADESPARGKLHPFDYDRRASNGRRAVDVWLPIHHWTAAQVWADIRASGVPYHRAYDLGMPRLSCAFCIFAKRDALMIAGKHNPELLAQYADTERAIGHQFQGAPGSPKGISLVEIQSALASGEQPPQTAHDWSM